MKTIILLTLILTASISKAADTTYVNAPQLASMLGDYTQVAYSYDVSREVALADNNYPDIVADINTWFSTEEGNNHAITDGNWNGKCESFLKSFPQHRSNKEIACKILAWEVVLHIKLFVYFNNASIVLVDGVFDGIIFFDRNINEPSRWHKTLKDPKFKQVYETGEDEGISWYYRIQKAIAEHQ